MTLFFAAAARLNDAGLCAYQTSGPVDPCPCWSCAYQIQSRCNKYPFAYPYLCAMPHIYALCFVL
eukprot:264647-Pelagomonas_calceolata.AAC.1